MLGLPSCKEVTEQSSQLLDEQLSGWPKFKLRLHLMMCDRCRRYQQQMRLTSATIRYWMKGKPMPEKVKQRILERLESEGDCHH